MTQRIVKCDFYKCDNRAVTEIRYPTDYGGDTTFICAKHSDRVFDECSYIVEQLIESYPDKDSFHLDIIPFVQKYDIPWSDLW